MYTTMYVLYMYTMYVTICIYMYTGMQCKCTCNTMVGCMMFSWFLLRIKKRSFISTCILSFFPPLSIFLSFKPFTCTFMPRVTCSLPARKRVLSSTCVCHDDFYSRHIYCLLYLRPLFFLTTS